MLLGCGSGLFFSTECPPVVCNLPVAQLLPLMHTLVVEIFGADAILSRPAARMPEPGDLLVSAPSITDPTWRRVVVLTLANDTDGAVGVILNRRAALRGGSLPAWLTTAEEVLIGGPVAPEGLIGIGDPKSGVATSMILPEVAIMDLERMESDGAIQDVTQQVARESVTSATFPWRLFAGYAGWGHQQLQDEMERGDWAVVAGTSSDVLNCDPDEVWSRVLLRQSHPINLWARLPDDPDMN